MGGWHRPDRLIHTVSIYLCDHLKQSKREECNEQLELKQRDIVRLREREKALVAAFQATLGENNKFEDFLTKVFKKKMKRVKKKELTRPDGEERPVLVCVCVCVSVSFMIPLCVCRGRCAQRRRL